MPRSSSRSAKAPNAAAAESPSEDASRASPLSPSPSPPSRPSPPPPEDPPPPPPPPPPLSSAAVDDAGASDVPESPPLGVFARIPFDLSGGQTRERHPVVAARPGVRAPSSPPVPRPPVPRSRSSSPRFPRDSSVARSRSRSRAVSTRATATCDAALNPSAPVTKTAEPPTPSHPIPPRPFVPASTNRFAFSRAYTAGTPNFPPLVFFFPPPSAFFPTNLGSPPAGNE